MIKEENRLAYRGLFAVNFLVCLGFGIVDPFFPVYATNSGATGFHLAILFSGYAIAKTIFSPLTGWWSDRKGRQALLISGLCTYTAISLGYIFFSGPIQLILLRFLQGIAAAFVRPVSLAFIGDMAPTRREGVAMGTFDISFYSALAVGPVLGGVIKDMYGFPGIFYSLLFLCLLALCVTMFFVKSPGNGEVRTYSGRGLNLSILKESKLLVALCGFIFTRSFGIVLFAIYMPIYMNENLNFKGIEIGMIMSVSAIFTALLLRPMGYLSDRMSRDRLIFIGSAAAAIFTICLPMAGTFPLLLGLSIGIGIASVLSLPASFALLVEEGNRHGMGLTMGIFNSAMNLGFVIAPLAGGIVFAFFEIKVVFYSAGLVGLVGSFFYLVYTVQPHISVSKNISPVSRVLTSTVPVEAEKCICHGRAMTTMGYPCDK